MRDSRLHLLGEAFALVLLMGGAARADPAMDMSTTTCQDWLDASYDDQELMVSWLRGYGAAKGSSTLFNVDKVRSDLNSLSVYCHGHLTAGVIDAMSNVRR